jgi:heat shock protein HslJ
MLALLPQIIAAQQAAPKSFALTEVTWQLVAIQSMDDAQGTRRIEHPEKFSLRFAANGRAHWQIDCNRGSATWKAEPSLEASSGKLIFGPLALTKMRCPPGSPDQKIINSMPHVRSYLLKEGKLFLSLKADGGIYEWQPMKASPRNAQPVSTTPVRSLNLEKP